MIRILNLDENDDSLENYSVIPGFKSNGVSLLSEMLININNPGIFIKEISMILKKLSSGEQIDINWNNWFDKNFDFDKKEDKVNSFNKLKTIINNAEQVNITVADVIMYAQFVDVARELKIDLYI